MNRHAYFILAYNNPNQLKTLIRLLDDARNDIYVHIDKDSKSFPMKIFENLTENSKLYVVPRISIYWAEYSQVELQFKMLKAAKANNRGYSYYHYMSGMDLPLKNRDEIYAYFENSGKEFIGIVPTEGEYQRRHVNYYYPLLKIKKYHEKKLLRVISEASASIQKLFRVDRTKNRNSENWTFVDGWDWFSITDQCAEYMLAKEEQVHDLFFMSKCPSEMAFQTVLYNSPFRDMIFDMKDLKRGSARLIDWTRGRPYIFRLKDFDELIQSECMFARKFDERVDCRIIDEIATYIRNII